MRDQIDMTPALLDYVRDVSLREEPVLRKLREETAALPDRIMQILPEEAQLLALLIRLTGAREVLEIGTFTGYSSLCMARALPAGGRLVTCDLSEEWTAVARRAWQEAELLERIELRLGDALETLDALFLERGPACFDMVFIDADKAHYPQYYEQSLALTRPGGLIVLDNTLWSGRVTDPTQQDPDTLGVRSVNDTLLADERIDLSMLPMADGITIARKR
ncbi:class I SAM-dependent methyltransferase [Streptomyces sp. RKAG293]|uniref:O-methyltransferase n=1 Tax=Streptomyces sp. RKAG293 TaxID=2893403 RepID=UPI002033ADB7|nr:class I SAM-dependent methyltransferase [Streptomyces sp. RKAG293]MCM2420592.1 class I SAM-dependent methyltransferase [Streptomyces sp. RKAG293]